LRRILSQSARAIEQDRAKSAASYDLIHRYVTNRSPATGLAWPSAGEGCDEFKDAVGFAAFDGRHYEVN